MVVEKHGNLYIQFNIEKITFNSIHYSKMGLTERKLEYLAETVTYKYKRKNPIDRAIFENVIRIKNLWE